MGCRYVALALVAYLATTGLLYADIVELKDTGEKIEGKIIRETADYIVVVVLNDKGQLHIKRNRIKSIEYDIQTQLEKIEADDFLGHYKVGIWAFDKGMYEEALSEFEALDGKEGIPPERLKYMGRAYEQRKQLDKALAAYSDYIKSKPNDKEVADRIPLLIKEVQPEGTANGTNTPAVAEKPKIAEGLEATGAWNAETWDNPARSIRTTDPVTGNVTIAMSSEGGAKEKCAVTRTLTAPPLKLSDSKEMLFKVFFASTGAGNVAIAFINSKGEYFESRALKLIPNTWNTLTLKIDGKDFKTEKSKWKHEVALDGADVSRIVFQFHAQKFSAHIDSVFFKSKDEKDKGP